MCCRSFSTNPSLCRKTTKTATPPSGVTARCVSRRISRSFDSRALISRGTELSAASGFILLLSQMSTRKQNAELRNSGSRIYLGHLYPIIYPEQVVSVARYGELTTEHFTQYIRTTGFPCCEERMPPFAVLM